MIRAPPCSRCRAQAVVSSISRHIAPTPRAAMPRRSSANHAALQVVAAAEAADDGVVAHLDAR